VAKSTGKKKEHGRQNPKGSKGLERALGRTRTVFRGRFRAKENPGIHLKGNKGLVGGEKGNKRGKAALPRQRHRVTRKGHDRKKRKAVHMGC